MSALSGWLTNSDLVIAGGWIIVLILVLTFVMWVLILDRYLYLWRSASDLVAATFDRWQALRTADARCNQRLRAATTESFHATLARWLGTIRVITAILPLLGLLGTVAGMIQAVRQDRLLDLAGDPVGVWPSGARQAIDQAVCAVGLVVASDLVELLPAVAHDPAGPGHVVELGGQLQQRELAPCYLVFRGHVSLLIDSDDRQINPKPDQ